MSQDIPELKGRSVLLRRACDGDVAGRMALGNTPDIQKMFGCDPAASKPITQEAARAWVESQICEPYAWIIETDGQLIGSVRVHSPNPADCRASLAIGILDPARLGQGLGPEAMRLVIAYAFDVLGFHRLSVRVLDFNARAIAAYRKLGFVEEGRERQSARIADAWHDDVIMGLLAPEFFREARA